MVQIILCDENCEGQAKTIFTALKYLGYAELFSLELKTIPDVGLSRGVDDETIWRFCQENRCLLLTDNRTSDDGEKSLEQTVRHLITDTSLPVLTISNVKRIPRDKAYLERCAHQIAEIVADLEERYLGTNRLYLP